MVTQVLGKNENKTKADHKENGTERPNTNCVVRNKKRQKHRP